MRKFYFQSDNSDDGWHWYSGSGVPSGQVEQDAERSDENSFSVVLREMALILLTVLAVTLIINVGLRALGLA